MKDIRTAGILMPVFSLPSDYGIGTFGKSAYEFVDFLKETHQSFWQVLPLGPTSFGDSPYQSPSTYAGNPYFIDLDILNQEGLLKKCDYAHLKTSAQTIDYEALYFKRYPVLKIAYQNFCKNIPTDYASFINNNYEWLHDYALFMSIKDDHYGASFDCWPNEYKFYNKEFLREYKSEYIDFYYFLQYKFSCQWNALKQYANDNGIRIIGDIPIYVAYDSSDVWANASNFKLDKNLKPTKVAGCPPDAFSADGQLWGNPIYNYALMKKDNYSWWIKRIKRAFEIYDVVRVDHFRGFEAYWSIPAKDTTARGGKWVKGPNYSLFKAIKEALGDVDFIAEDLGFLTPGVYKLLEMTGFPGMKVLEFGFDGNPQNQYLPVSYTKNCICYIGTHDNYPALGWYNTLNEWDKKIVNLMLGVKSPNTVSTKMIKMALNSVANTVIIQLQDYLNLGEEGRVNTPSTLGTNWLWRVKKNYKTASLTEHIRKLTDDTGRYNG